MMLSLLSSAHFCWGLTPTPPHPFGRTYNFAQIVLLVCIWCKMETFWLACLLACLLVILCVFQECVTHLSPIFAYATWSLVPHGEMLRIATKSKSVSKKNPVSNDASCVCGCQKSIHSSCTHGFTYHSEIQL